MGIPVAASLALPATNDLSVGEGHICCSEINGGVQGCASHQIGESLSTAKMQLPMLHCPGDWSYTDGCAVLYVCVVWLVVVQGL
jgi:hypothetical protein